MANYVFYEGRWRGHSQNDTIPEQAKTFLSRRQDTDTGIIYYYDGSDWLRSGTHDVGANYMQMTEIAVPTAPTDDNKYRLFIDSATGLLSQIDSDEVVTSIGSGGGEGAGGNGIVSLSVQESAPQDPDPDTTSLLYSKDKDINNQGVFVKYKINGSVEEVELGVADDVLSLTELSDVTITSPADEHVLIHNGTQFINRVLAAADLPASVPLLNTSNIFTAIQKIQVDNGQQLTFYRPVNTAGFGAGFYYNFNTSTNAEATYGFQYIGIEDNTNGAHRGDFYVQLARAGSLGICFRVYTGGNGGIIFGNNSRIQIDEGGLTAARVYTLPDSDQTLVGRTGTATLTNKTMSGASNTFTNIPDSALSANVPLKNGSNSFTALQTFRDNLCRIWNPGVTAAYMFRTSAIGANRDMTLPALGGNDTFVFQDHAQTITNKTVGTTGLTFAQVASASVATPSSGNITLFLNSGDSKLSVKDSSGTVTALY